jgi:hypothetical protein
VTWATPVKWRPQTPIIVIVEADRDLLAVAPDLPVLCYRAGTLITGLSAVGAAAILAETGDPPRVRHRPRGSQACRPGGAAEPLRRMHRPDQADRPGTPCGCGLAAWRAVWAAQRANPVYRARYQSLTGREHSKLTPTQAQTVIAAAILRLMHVLITIGQAWDPGHGPLGVDQLRGRGGADPDRESSSASVFPAWSAWPGPAGAAGRAGCVGPGVPLQ